MMLEPPSDSWRMNIRLMFRAMVTRLHPSRTWSIYHSRNWRKPSIDLMMPNIICHSPAPNIYGPVLSITMATGSRIRLGAPAECSVARRHRMVRDVDRQAEQRCRRVKQPLRLSPRPAEHQPQHHLALNAMP
jgi:hypothetical protein